MDNQSERDNQETESCRCEGKRNIVVCIDGTSNQFGQKNTNVIELYSQLVKNDTQLTYYSSGIGTYAEPSWKSFNHWKQVLHHKIDLAIAWNFDKIVLNAYRWISDHYQDGDRIFLFGFSRGAYQVRVLAGMIDKVGLIYKGNEEQIPFAYELYRDPSSDRAVSRKPGHDRELQQTTCPVTPAQRFKETFSRKGVRIHFTGVWDTVSSVGIVRGKNLPGTVSPHHTCFFRHALALDERRVKFLPEYARGGIMMMDQNGQSRDSFQGGTTELGWHQQARIKEVWFSGTHSDIGGGNVLNDDLDRRHPAFLWMLYEAASAHLNLNSTNVEWKWDELNHVHESLTLGWKLFEYLPFKRLSYKDAESHTWRPHRGCGRKIQPGQRVHASVAFRKDYHPKAHLPSEPQEDRWYKLVGSGNKFNTSWTRQWGDLLEMDIFDASTADTVIKKIQDPSINKVVWVHRLTVMTWSPEGRGALRKIDGAARHLIKALPSLDMQIRVAVANAVMEFVIDDSDIEILLDVVRDGEDLGGSEGFLENFIRDATPSSLKLRAFEKLVDHAGSRSKILKSSMATLSARPEDLESYKARHFTLNAIKKLAKHEDSRREMLLDFSLVSALLGKLHDEDEDVRRSIINVLPELAEHEDLRCKMFDSELVTVLLAMLGDPNEGARQSIVISIAHLAKHYDSRCKLFDSDIVTVLFARLGDRSREVRRSLVDTIAGLTRYEDLRPTWFDSDLVAVLLTRLGDDDAYVRRSTVNVITELIKYERPRRKMIASNIVVVLLAKFGDQIWTVRKSIVLAITELAKYEHLRNKMLDSEIITVLLAGLEDERGGVRWSVVDAIVELAKHDDARRKIVDSDIVEILRTKFEDQRWEVRRSIANAVIEFLKYEDSRPKIFDFNIIPALLNWLQDEDADVRCSAVIVITQFAIHGGSCSNSDLIMALLARLEDHSWGVRRSIADAITELAKYEHPRCQMFDPDVISILLARLGDPIWLVRLSIVNSITELTEYEHPNHKMPDYIVVALFARLKDEIWSVRRSAVNGIMKLVKYEHQRHKMLNIDIVPVLLVGLEDRSWGVRQSTVSVIMELAKYGQVSKAITNPDANSKTEDSRLIFGSAIFVALLAGCADEVWTIRRSTADAIVELAKYEDLRFKIFDPAIVAVLVLRLQDKNADVRQSIVNIIAELIKHHDSHSKIVDFNIVPALLTRLGDQSLGVSRSTAQAIAELAERNHSCRKIYEDYCRRRGHYYNPKPEGARYHMLSSNIFTDSVGQTSPRTPSWVNWQPDHRYIPTPPTAEQTLLVPPRGSPGLFSPQSSSDSLHD